MLPFLLPPPPGHKAVPQWDGQAFVMDGVRTRVLEYGVNLSGWCDDLTCLHEESVGDAHPLDMASRADAVAQVAATATGSCPVILEVGCSSGYLLRDLRAALPHACLIGADVVRGALSRLAEQLPGTPLICCDLLECPVPDRSVDVLVMLNVLEHIEDDRRALRKAHDLLRPGGHLVLEVPAGAWLFDAYDRELCHYRRYGASELRGKLAQAGFSLRRSSHLGFLLFPAFAAVKLLGRLRPDASAQPVVRRRASRSSGGAVQLALEVERSLLSHCRLPFGIRVLATARRED